MADAPTSMLTDPATPPPAATPPAGSTPPPGGTQSVQLQALPDNWYEGLPDDLKNEGSLRSFKDIPSLAKSYVHAQKAIGADKVVIPGKLATEDDWNNFYSKVGMPKAEDYKLTLPKDSQVDPATIKAFQDVAIKSNILPKQAEAVVAWFTDAAKKQTEAQTQQIAAQREQEFNGLKKEWGEGYDTKINRAKNAFQHYADPEVKAYLAETGMGNDPKLVKLFAKIGDSLAEHNIVGDGPGGPVGKTPEELQEEITSIFGDRSHPYHNSQHPGHQSAVQHVQSLFQRKTQGT